MAEVILTSEGKKQKEQRLDFLKVVKRQEVAERIKAAREFGDITENAEYDAAKEEQAMVEGEINELEAELRLARVIDDRVDTATVSVGTKVKFIDLEFNEEQEYMIVGTSEADPAARKISNESPVGIALLGRKKGETVTVNAPQGKFQVKILKIS